MITIFKNFVEYIKYSPAIIQITWLLIALFSVLIVNLTLYLKHLRSRLRSKERTLEKYQQKYESLLIEYLYSENEGDETNIKQLSIINYLKKSSVYGLQRKIIISTLLKLKNEISGEIAVSIQKLYYQIGLESYALKNLKSKKWDVTARAIKELSLFEITETQDEILKYMNHPKKEVRKEVQIYLVRLFRFEGLKFLDNLTTSLSEWDQIQLLEILQKNKENTPPDLTNWLKSSNDSVVSFALKLAKIYYQYEVKEIIISLLYHHNEEIRISAIQALSHLSVTESKEILKENLTKRSIDEQIAVFKLFENLSDSNDISFIKEYVNNENFEIKVSVMKILNIITEDETHTFKIISNNEEYSESINLIKAS
jgi:hypothetical protein